MKALKFFLIFLVVAILLCGCATDPFGNPVPVGGFTVSVHPWFPWVDVELIPVGMGAGICFDSGEVLIYASPGQLVFPIPQDGCP